MDYSDAWGIVRACYPILARLLDEADVPFDNVVDVVDWVPIPEGEEGYGPGKHRPVIEKNEAHGWFLTSGGLLRDTEEWPDGPWWPNYYLSHDGQRVYAETFAEAGEHRPSPVSLLKRSWIALNAMVWFGQTMRRTRQCF